MSAGLTVARELSAALGDALLALPRQLAFLAAHTRHCDEFRALRRDPPPPAAAPEPPAQPLSRLVLSCGDASGENHALRLLEALRRRHPGLAVRGFGGARLQAAGMEIWEPLADWNVMGFRDVAARLPRFFGCVRRYAQELEREPPDAVVLVDYPGLNRHLLRIAARRGVPVVDYIAPQLWAWAPWRVRDFRKADRLLAILPFERDWYGRHGAAAEYVGHPLGDGLEHAAQSEAPAPRLDPSCTWVGLLPGSRRREVRENLPVLLAAAAELARRQPGLRFVLPHLRSEVWPQIEAGLAAAPVPVLAAPGSYHGVLAQLRAAWVVSGTALLETAAHGVPPVLLYRLSSGLAEWGYRHFLSVPRVGSLNLLADQDVVPEHVAHQPDPRALAADLEAFLEGPARERALAAIRRWSVHFALPGAAERAARAVEAAARPAQRGESA